MEYKMTILRTADAVTADLFFDAEKHPKAVQALRDIHAEQDGTPEKFDMEAESAMRVAAALYEDRHGRAPENPEWETIMQPLLKDGFITMHPGGSAFNTCASVLGAIHCDENPQTLDFFTAFGNGPLAKRIRENASQRGVHLIPDMHHQHPEWASQFHTTISFVFPDAKGERAIAKAKQIRELSGETMTMDAYFESDEGQRQLETDAGWRDCNVVFLSGSLLKKSPELYKSLYDKVMNNDDIQLYVSLPTSNLTEDQKSYLFGAMQRADVILSNEKELEMAFADNSYENLINFMQEHSHRAKTAFITRGKEGAAILESDGTRHDIDIWPDERPLVNATGAGDNAYAGFMAGIMQGYSPVQAGHIGMKFASECIRQHAAQLANPKVVFEEATASPRVLVDAATISTMPHKQRLGCPAR